MLSEYIQFGLNISHELLGLTIIGWFLGYYYVHYRMIDRRETPVNYLVIQKINRKYKK